MYIIKALPQENKTGLYAKTKERQRNSKSMSLGSHRTNISPQSTALLKHNAAFLADVHISCIERDAELVPLVLWRQFILTTSSAHQICQASNMLPTKVEAFKSSVVWSWKQEGGNQSQRRPWQICVLSLSHKSQELSIEFVLYLDVGPFLSLAAIFNVFL